MRTIVNLTAAIALCFSSAIMAEFEFDKSKAYAGGGLAYNSPDSGFDSAIGYQGFGGYDISDLVPIDEQIGLAVEIGYASSGNFSSSGCSALFGSLCDLSSDGLWSTAVFDYQVKDQIKAIGRIGYDFADANGLIIGAGALYQINSQMDAVLEYVIRDFHQGLQANFIYHL